MKKTIAIVLSALLIFTLFAACGKTDSQQAEQSSPAYEYTHRDLAEPVYIEPSESFSGGDGTQESPYEIATAAELALFEKLVDDAENTPGNEYRKAHYILTADIELNNTESYASWAETAPQYSWNPVDEGEDGLVFDGNGHTISGLYINLDTDKSKSEYGLFGSFAGTVKNLNVDKAYISVSGNTNYVGTIVAYLRDTGRVENCTANSVIDCYDNEAGGIVGYAAGGLNSRENERKFPVISGCTFDGSINQIKKHSLNMLGGIVASGDAEITSCINNGTITFGGKDIDKAGGIIGFSGEGRIADCENNGDIICIYASEDEVAGSSIAGGIIGSAFQSATGTTNMSRGLTIENCRNNGKVSAEYSAGGIAGAANNSNNEWCLAIKDCVNNAEVNSNEILGGVIGSVDCSGKNVNGDNLVIENCVNNVSLKADTAGGVIGQFAASSGDIVIRGCKNLGDVDSVGQNAGGIISYFYTLTKTDIRITVEGCENSGDITSALNAGGIFGRAGNEGSDTPTASSVITLKNCKNSGDISAENYNGYVGGIAGNWGMKELKTTFVGCENSGDITIDAEDFDPATLESETSFTLSRICGGIVGRVGSALMLTTDSDKAREININNENSVFVFENCVNTGEYEVEDEESYSFENGAPVYKNYFGGIIGNACAQDGYSILVKDCRYTNFARGLGNEELPDVGEKA